MHSRVMLHHAAVIDMIFSQSDQSWRLLLRRLVSQSEQVETWDFFAAIPQLATYCQFGIQFIKFIYGSEWDAGDNGPLGNSRSFLFGGLKSGWAAVLMSTRFSV